MRSGCRSQPRAARLLPFALAVLLLAACGATTSAAKDDATISTHVKIALLNDPQVGALRLDAKTVERVVTLSGTVRSQAEAETAIRVAGRVAGVRRVASELKIVP